jgi:hypothetical protein
MFTRSYNVASQQNDIFLSIKFESPFRDSGLMKYTQHTLDKLEAIVEEAGYVLRYERGTFQSGYCILEQRKVVVLNKFLQLEGRINTMLDLIPQLEIKTELLGEESRKVHKEILSKLETENGNQ